MSETKIDPKDRPLLDTIKSLPEEKRLAVLVEDMPFSTRVWNCLDAGKVKTLGDITLRTEAELLRIKNFGRDSLREVKEYMAEVGLGVGTRKKSIPRSTPAQTTQVVTYPANVSIPPASVPSVWFVGPPRGTTTATGSMTVPPVQTGGQLALQFNTDTREQAELKKLLADMKRMIARIEEVLS